MEYIFCPHCGERYSNTLIWPRNCIKCSNTVYKNPLPAAVMLLKVEDGILVIRRGIQPRLGELALPGGYINVNESWQNAAVRELEEETGIVVPVSEVTLFDVKSAPDGTVLIFGMSNKNYLASLLPKFQPTNETIERLIITSPMFLAFPIHTEMLARYFNR